MAVGGIGADDENHVGLHHRVEILGAGRFAQGLLQPVPGGRVTDARARVDVVVAEPGADQLLHQIGFLVGAARGGDGADGVAAVLRLDALHFGGRVRDRLLPGHLAPGIADLGADHGLHDAVRVGGVADGKPALDARMPVVGMAVLVRDHAHHFLALHLCPERAAHAAIGAGGHHAVLGLALGDQAVFREGRGRTGLHAGAAGHALGIHEADVLARRHLRVEAAALNGQRQGALLFVAGPHAARADDALAGIEGEIGIARILRRIQVVGAVVPIAHLAQAHDAGHVLQLAMAVGGAGQAVQGVI